MSEPREFWICWPKEPGTAYVMVEPSYVRDSVSQVIRVVEHSAYDALKAQLAQAERRIELASKAPEAKTS